MNWMNIWTVVTNKGQGKPKRSFENIHLLYTERTVASMNLEMGYSRVSVARDQVVPCGNKQPVHDRVSPPNALFFFKACKVNPSTDQANVWVVMGVVPK